ncbi:hypothetical protein [Bacillus sp. BPN334]|uniref:hypothetical protein n=1 Tax=Bacillus sp. BPN334 TaxID=2217815 RepID=UPI0011F0889F|nr:hypothetical protein [Bacillus sp. BPN334]KAA0781242.1 hypothetical protein DN393_29950 [Bacillus sp. BPN334]
MNENMTSNSLGIEEKAMGQGRKWGMDIELLRQQAIESNNEIIEELSKYETTNKQVALELTVRIADLKQQNEMLQQKIEPVDPKVQACWESYWRDILVKNGQLDITQVKKELFDYKYVREQREVKEGMYLDDIRMMSDKHGMVKLSDLERYFKR